MNPGTFYGKDGEALLPTTLRDKVRAVVGVSDARVRRFARITNNVGAVEQIPVKKNQQPVLTDENLVINVSKA
jgi:hypothetical protein